MSKGSPRYRLSVAPMIDWTDRYCRTFHRLLAPNTLLYTEMVVADAILSGDQGYLLGYDPCQHPVALQLGGSDPQKLADAAQVGEAYGYDEINLNVGCPSDRVQSGRFGACLMQTPGEVAAMVTAMRRAVKLPVTVKCRIGVDDQEPRDVLPDFCDRMIEAGADTITVHARKAWLQGLSPKENRTIPPLDYELVAEVAAARAGTPFILNGGLATLEAMRAEAARFDGIMVGRAFYENPMLLAEAERAILRTEEPIPSRAAIAAEIAARAEAEGTPIWRYGRHMLGLFHGGRGAKAWRRRLSEEGRADYATPSWLAELAAEMEAARQGTDDDTAAA